MVTLAGVKQFTDVHATTLLLLAPVLYAAHILEEATGFVPWFNSIVSRGISQKDFLPSNITPLAITALLAATAAILRYRAPMIALLAWISFYMFANAIFHVTATVVLVRYCPGTITATLLYLPYFAWFVTYLTKQFRIRATTVATIVLIAGFPMFLQGYMIVFQASRFY